MDLSPVIVQIRAQVATFSDRVAGAASFEAAQGADDVVVPAAYVVPVGDEVEQSQTAGGIVQSMNEVIGVIVAVDNTSDARGQAAADQLETIRAALWAALLGWDPDASGEQFEYAGGTIVGMTRARVWMQFDFAKPYTITSV